jgi:hypothetical protein
MKKKVIVTSLVVLTLLVFAIARRHCESPGEQRWNAFCLKSEELSVELAKRYYALTPEAQAEMRKGMAPPDKWVHFDCRKSWQEFGEACTQQTQVPAENCVYAGEMKKIKW